jgi:hypothetical protein
MKMQRLNIQHQATLNAGRNRGTTVAELIRHVFEHRFRTKKVA